MANDLQLLILLDLDTDVAESEVTPLLPDARHKRELMRATELGAPRIPYDGPVRGPIDWDRTGDAIEAVAAKAWERIEASPHPVRLYVAGRAPIPAFVHLGFALSKFRAAQTLLNPRHGGGWEAYPLGATADADSGAEPYFDVVLGLDESRPKASTARVAVYVATRLGEAPVEKIRDALRAHNRELGGVVEIRPSALSDVTPERGPGIAAELARVISSIATCYPDAAGLALFLALPAQLAFLVGRAVNPNVTRDVWVANYDGKGYDVAVRLPFRSSGRLVRSDSADDRLARGEVLKRICDGADELRELLQPADLPDGLDDRERRRFVDILRSIRDPREPDGEAFSLNAFKRAWRLGAGILEALRPLAPERQLRFGQLLLLHELFHVWQGVQSVSYYGVGRAGVVLEEVDYAADAFALHAVAAMCVRDGGARAAREVAALVTDLIDTVLDGIAAFDRLEQGERIQRLYERRLRRYLIWHLQRLRAETVTSPRQVGLLLGPRLTVELAPLNGFLDERFDKVVRGPLPNTELFCVLGSRLVRLAQREGFEPGALLDAVRGFDRAAIGRTLAFVVGEAHAVLLPWADAPHAAAGGRESDDA